MRVRKENITVLEIAIIVLLIAGLAVSGYFAVASRTQSPKEAVLGFLNNIGSNPSEACQYVEPSQSKICLTGLISFIGTRVDIKIIKEEQQGNKALDFIQGTMCDSTQCTKIKPPNTKGAFSYLWTKATRKSKSPLYLVPIKEIGGSWYIITQ